MEEKELIQETIKSCEESIAFFSNPNKLKREIWVVTEFLKNLGIDFQNDELKSVSSDPPDIVFRDAKFEIKEIDEENRKRHDEYKQKLKKAKSAVSLKDLMTPYQFKEITMQEIVSRIDRKLKELDYTADFCINTDILFYINYSLIGQHNYTIVAKKAWEKWRSVSMATNNNISCIFCATADAPIFIKSTISRVTIRKNRT